MGNAHCVLNAFVKRMKIDSASLIVVRVLVMFAYGLRPSASQLERLFVERQEDQERDYIFGLFYNPRYSRRKEGRVSYSI